jgi:TRAP-type C4-dicarboxylate transport system permease small subunit
MYSKLVNGLNVLAQIIIFAILCVIIVDVSLRFLGLPQWQQAISVVEYGLLWFVFLAAPKLTVDNSHIVVNIIKSNNPVYKTCIHSLCFVICFVYSCVSLWVLNDSYVTDRLDVRATELPMVILLAPMPICFFLMSLEFLRKIILVWNGTGR